MISYRKDDEEEPGRLELISQAQKAKRRKAAQKAGPGKQGNKIKKCPHSK